MRAGGRGLKAEGRIIGPEAGLDRSNSQFNITRSNIVNSFNNDQLSFLGMSKT